MRVILDKTDVIPREAKHVLHIFGTGQDFMASNFSGSVCMPASETLCPR